jgi:hypothetical protein
MFEAKLTKVRQARASIRRTSAERSASKVLVQDNPVTASPSNPPFVRIQHCQHIVEFVSTNAGIFWLLLSTGGVAGRLSFARLQARR